MQQFVELVEDQRVALVGNANSLLTMMDNKARDIDASDIVIRMNAGLPGVLPAERVGRKTDIWATAKHFPGLQPPAKLMMFMKLTELGDRHWERYQDNPLFYPMWRWTQELEDEVRDYVGADPGTGIRLLYLLKRYAKPKSVTCYGMDCWDTVSSWSGKPNTPNHVPMLEKEAMLSLMQEDQ